MKEILAWHAKVHPSMQPQDAIKLCYQAVFGAEHLLTDEDRARSYFEREWESLTPVNSRLWEPISERYGRVDLAVWKFADLPSEWLFRMFFLTASQKSPQGHDELQGWLDSVEEMTAEQQLPFSREDWLRTRSSYEQNGGGAVHHSERYRAAEHPAYRVVDRRYIALIPLLKRLASMSQNLRSPKVIAIDGRAASGKTTLAKQLADILGAGIVHMDDFFLPPALRTPERLAEAGGNVHYERFIEQVLPHLKNNEAFTYPVFDCSKMSMDGERTVIAGSWRIVEGSYSHHPQAGNYMDLRVFCHVTAQEQMRRILARNGERMAQMFAERWIPMEEIYFKTYNVHDRADISMTNEANDQGESI